MWTLARLAPFRNAFLFRGLGMWVFARLSAAFVGIADPNLVEEILILAVCAAAVLLDARRRREDLVLGNLTIPSTAIVLWALPLACLAEFFVP